MSVYKCKLLVILFAVLSVSAFASKPFADTINVKKYGVKGDGQTDDYQALLKVVAMVNQRGGGTLLFPEGTYYIGTYHFGKGDKNADFVFTNCNNLHIIGRNAKIVLNGKFKRTADYNIGKFTYSYNNTIIPFWIANCSNVIIRGFDIDGGVRNMTKDPNVAERGGFLINIVETDNVTLRDLQLHYASTDGIAIRGTAKPSTKIDMRDVVSENNARQGMSIGNVVGAYFYNCKFRNTGQTGAYGAHLPTAGVDIEPGKLTNGQQTRDLTFRNCVFENNQGGQLLLSSPTFTSGVRFASCAFNAGNTSKKYQLILSAKNVVVDSCTIDCGPGNIYATWKSTPGSSVEITNSTIKSANSGIIALSDSDADQLNVSNNKLICTSNSPLASYFPYMRMKNLKFNRNQVTMNTAAMKAGKASSIIENAAESTDNNFQTEGGRMKPKVSYKGTLRVKEQ